MKPYTYQVELAKQSTSIIKSNGLVYLAMEERTGKSIVGLLVAEQCNNVSNVLIITKKKSLTGWQETIQSCKWLTKNYTLVNYHCLHKLEHTNYDLIIIDEAHCYISACPKTSAIWKKIRVISYDLPIIYMSATPYAQGMHLLYHQLAITKYSCWNNYKNFYHWYRVYAYRNNFGLTDKIRIRGMYKETYKKMDSKKVMADISNIFVIKTRKELNFLQEPEDILHYVDLSQNIRNTYNKLMKNKTISFTARGENYTLFGDSSIKLRSALHMLEGGVLKVDNNYIVLSNTEKIDYIKAKWGDTKDIAIMYNYVAEKDKLESHFRNARILQCTSYAEGIDLSNISHLIIYSQDFSTARHTQRRARQTNRNREETIRVHFLLVEKAISAQVYKTVSINKVNFVDSLFKRNII